MAASVLIEKDISIGATEHLYVVAITLDNSYPTGGYALDPAANQRLERLLVPNAGGYTFEWIPASQKLKIYRGDNANASPAPGVEVSAAVDLSVTPGVVYGIGIGF
jgi:hypothetical protein